MSYHSPIGFRNAREFGCGCRAWFEPGSRLLWVEACRPACPIVGKLQALGEARGFAVGVLGRLPAWGVSRRSRARR